MQFKLCHDKLQFMFFIQKSIKKYELHQLMLSNKFEKFNKEVHASLNQTSKF